MQKQIQKDFQQTLTFFLCFLFSHDDSRFQKMASNMVRIPSTTNSKICKKNNAPFFFFGFFLLFHGVLLSGMLSRSEVFPV